MKFRSFAGCTVSHQKYIEIPSFYDSLLCFLKKAFWDGLNLFYILYVFRKLNLVGHLQQDTENLNFIAEGRRARLWWLGWDAGKNFMMKFPYIPSALHQTTQSLNVSPMWSIGRIGIPRVPIFPLFGSLALHSALSQATLSLERVMHAFHFKRASQRKHIERCFFKYKVHWSLNRPRTESTEVEWGEFLEFLLPRTETSGTGFQNGDGQGSLVLPKREWYGPQGSLGIPNMK